MNRDITTTRKGTFFKKRLMIWCVGVFAFLLVGLTLVRALITADGTRIQTLHDFASSNWLFIFRLTLYVALWCYWNKILGIVNLGKNVAIVSATRKPLLILLVGYEFLFATNILGNLV